MRRTRTLALLAVVALLAASPGVAAAESRAGGTVVVGEGETITEDLEASGGSVIVHGTVEGDLDAGAGSVLITGTVTGDVEAGAGSVTVEGDVGGDVDAGAGSVTVAGTVDGDVRAGGGLVEVTEGARIDGSLNASADGGDSPFGSDDGRVVVDGTVGEDATIVADEIRLGPDAVIGGDLRYEGNLTRADGSTVEGEVVRDESLQVDAGGGGWLPAVPGPAIAGYVTLATLLLGAVLLGAFPRFSVEVADRVAAEPVRTGAYGVGVGVGVPLVLALVAVTIIGIPLSLAGGLLFAIAAWAGAVYGRFAVGAWLLSHADVENRWLALLAGVAVVALVGRVPVVGNVVGVAVFLVGFGALVLEAWERYQAGDGRPAAPAEPGPGRDADADPDAGPA